eukprot:TRINITY_DN118_c0_g2_i1.p1 TRINITY_DN118_c0_g2~~TRINITY_DN118_c0_g2_i1.p1  ORF type:complete len:332 (+),score=162.48 TRINITY_DN118_c0_g2_i1:121-1116(+)
MLSDYPEFKVATTKTIDETYNEQDERAITNVHVDGLVVLKILQHSQEYVPELVSGQCMGLGNGDVLEITHSFPLFLRKDGDDQNDAEAKTADLDYQSKMQESLRQVNVDCNVVGWYAVSWQEAHYSATVIDTMALYQEVLGEHTVCLLFDPLKSLQGKLYLKALRLKPQFLKMLKENADKKDFSQHIINNYSVTTLDIFNEVPISINNCHLIDQYLWELGRSQEWQQGTTEENLVAKHMALSPYQNISNGSLVENADNVLDELKKYMNITRRSRQMQDDDRQGGRPSRLETLYCSAQIHNLSKHIQDICHLTFESVSLAHAVQQAQSQPSL